ncbi:MAG: hypothetical protein ACE5FR_14170, partial [Rhodospirillales bacterium]
GCGLSQVFRETAQEIATPHLLVQHPEEWAQIAQTVLPAARQRSGKMEKAPRQEATLPGLTPRFFIFWSRAHTTHLRRFWEPESKASR